MSGTMKHSILYSGVWLFFGATVLYGQTPAIPANSLVVIDLPDHSRMANVQDTNYTRVLDGLYIPTRYPVTESFREVAYVGNMEDVKLLKVNSVKPLMLISSKNFPVEALIDSVLEAHKQAPDYPSYVKLPFVLNGKVLEYAERQKLLPKLSFSSLTGVKYLTPEETRKKYEDTPFGIVELTCPSCKP